MKITVPSSRFSWKITCSNVMMSVSGTLEHVILFWFE